MEGKYEMCPVSDGIVSLNWLAYENIILTVMQKGKKSEKMENENSINRVDSWVVSLLKIIYFITRKSHLEVIPHLSEILTWTKQNASENRGEKEAPVNA